MGMGRYQWFVFLLCGFGYFLDLCWAQAFGLVASALQQELGVPNNHIGDLSTAFNTGLTVGAFTWGMLVDIVGRRWCFNLTCLIASIFGFLFAAPSNYGAICFFASLIGFGVGGNIPIDATITLEFLPKNRRFLLAALSTFQPIGVVVATLIAFGLIPSNSCATGLPSCKTGETPCCTMTSNRGWRYTMITLGAITMLIFFLRFVIFTFHESPKFLLSKGHDEQAIEVIYAVAKVNKRPVPTLTYDDFRALDAEEALRNGQDESGEGEGDAKDVVVGRFEQTFAHIKGLFKSKAYTYLFIILAIAFMSDFWSFSIAGFFLPLILRAKGVDTSRSAADTYRSYIWIYLPGVTAPLVSCYFMELPRLGRKWAMVLGAGLMGLSLALYQVVNSLPASIGFNAMEYWFQSFYNALLYAYTPEVFPAPFRGSACGSLSTLGRIASIVAPIATGGLYNGSSSPAVLWLAAGGAWLSMVMIALLPYDTKGKETL
ncbi:MFS general substrate transporter [Peniophora sp. CONT]|nr:MFS general substrate transporter [Peniophora sp. CONT]